MISKAVTSPEKSWLVLPVLAPIPEPEARIRAGWKGQGYDVLTHGRALCNTGAKVFCSHFRWTGRPGPRADIIVIIIIISIRVVL
jgi:hypothetical protein